MIHFKRQIFKNSIVLHSNLGFSKVFLLFHPCSANRATILDKEANTLQMISAIAVSAISPMHPLKKSPTAPSLLFQFRNLPFPNPAAAKITAIRV